MNRIYDISAFLINRGYVLDSLDKNEISFIEKQLKITLPQVYKEFLMRMGKGAGDYMKGSSVFYEDIFLLKEWCNELIAENELPLLPENAFVFWMHQGYQVAYFLLDDGDDPRIYFFSEGQDSIDFILKEKSLTDFFIAQLSFIPK